MFLSELIYTVDTHFLNRKLLATHCLLSSASHTKFLVEVVAEHRHPSIES